MIAIDPASNAENLAGMFWQHTAISDLTHFGRPSGSDSALFLLLDLSRPLNKLGLFT